MSIAPASIAARELGERAALAIGRASIGSETSSVCAEAAEPLVDREGERLSVGRQMRAGQHQAGSARLLQVVGAAPPV